MAVSSSLLEDNIDRVIDSVVRNVNAGRGAVPNLDALEIQESSDEASDARAVMVDLCGHVAYALRSLDSPPHALATYKAPEQPATAPTLNLVR
ncbi:MAG TPA: hypothetical protein VIG47_10200 [Gemmatimonadaceae bacterium]